MHRSKYSEIVIIGNYNADITETSMPEFYESYFLENVVKKQYVPKILQSLHILI